VFAEDLSVFFDTDDFAVEVALDGASVNGVMGDEPVEVNFVQTTAPSFIYRHADMAVSIDSDLVYGATAYKVKNMRPDGTGLMMLILEQQ